MDNSAFQQLKQGLSAIELELNPGQIDRLARWFDELLKWNRNISLTTITAPVEVVDKHLIDSLAVWPEVRDAHELLDLGAGAGLPGIPLAVALPHLKVTLVDSVAKKVAFLKSATVRCEIVGQVKAVHQRAEGDPDKEGLPRVDCVISRAFMDVGPFLSLAQHYLSASGRVVAMLGRSPGEEALRGLALPLGFQVMSHRTFTLPHSGDPRAVVTFGR